MASQIKTLLPSTNIYGDLCRIVADILVVEEAGQRALAGDHGICSDWRTYVHRTNPISHWDKDDFSSSADLSPVVNVTFDQANERPGSTTNVNALSKTFQLNVDCYACGVSSDLMLADEMCGRDALNLAGKVEQILHSGPYAYLGHRGLIQSRSIVTSQSFQPAVNDRAIQNVRCVRHSLNVVAVYDNYQRAGELFNAGLVTVLDNATGEVRFGIEVDFTEQR